MPFQQQSLSVRTSASLLWLVCFALLLSLLPVAPYGKAISVGGTTGLVNQFDSLATLYDNHFRFSQAKEHKSEHSSADTDPTDWHIVVSAPVFTECLICIGRSTSVPAKPAFSRTAYLRPLLRAPPQA